MLCCAIVSELQRTAVSIDRCSAFSWWAARSVPLSIPTDSTERRDAVWTYNSCSQGQSRSFPPQLMFRTLIDSTKVVCLQYCCCIEICLHTRVFNVSLPPTIAYFILVQALQNCSSVFPQSVGSCVYRCTPVSYLLLRFLY